MSMTKCENRSLMPVRMAWKGMIIFQMGLSLRLIDKRTPASVVRMVREKRNFSE